jgi:hypothetical protein
MRHYILVFKSIQEYKPIRAATLAQLEEHLSAKTEIKSVNYYHKVHCKWKHTFMTTVLPPLATLFKS